MSACVTFTSRTSGEEGQITLSLSLRRLAVSTNTTSTIKERAFFSYRRTQTIPYCSRWGQGSSRHWPWRRFQELSGEWEIRRVKNHKRQIIKIEYKKKKENPTKEEQTKKKKKIGRGELKLRLEVRRNAGEEKEKKIGRERWRGYFCDAIGGKRDWPRCSYYNLLSCAQPRNNALSNQNLIRAIAFLIKWIALSFYHNITQSGCWFYAHHLFGMCLRLPRVYIRDEEKSKKAN